MIVTGDEFDPLGHIKFSSNYNNELQVDLTHSSVQMQELVGSISHLRIYHPYPFSCFRYCYFCLTKSQMSIQRSLNKMTEKLIQ